MRIALLQCAPGAPDVGAGLARLDRFAAQAAAAGAALLVTPEMFLTGYAIGAEAVARLAEPSDGPAAEAVAAICRRHGLGILYGYPERGADGAVYNAIQLIGADGTPRANTRKTHLFGGVDRAQFTAGETLSPVVAFGGFRLGFAICYDIEFPEVARALALAGAEAVLVPTANMTPFESVATRLVPARAEENAVFVTYANYVGREAEFRYCGLSCVVGPDGSDLARADAVSETLVVADLDRNRLETARARVTYRADRRPDLYGALGEPR